MTNDEIKLEIAEHLSTHSYGVGSNILPLVGLVQSLVASAYEEAIKAECYLCGRGVPVEVSNRTGTKVVRHIPSNSAGRVLCMATKVRALKDLLVASHS